MQTKIQLNEPLTAPIVKGKSYGTINLMSGDQVIVSEPLIALADNPKGGFWRRLMDSFSFAYKKLFSHTSEKANNG